MLARWGYLCMNSTVNDWWGIWSVRPAGHGFEAELHAICRSNAAAPPSNSLREWAASLSDDVLPDLIDPATAGLWLGTLAHQRRTHRAHTPAPNRRRQGTVAPRLRAEFSIGRALFKGRNSSPGVRLGNGPLETDPASIDQILLIPARIYGRSNLRKAAPGLPCSPIIFVMEAASLPCPTPRSP